MEKKRPKSDQKRLVSKKRTRGDPGCTEPRFLEGISNLEFRRNQTFGASVSSRHHRFRYRQKLIFSGRCLQGSVRLPPHLTAVHNVDKPVASLFHHALAERRQIGSVIGVAAVGLDDGQGDVAAGRPQDLAALVLSQDVSRFAKRHDVAHTGLIEGLASFLEVSNAEAGINLLEFCSKSRKRIKRFRA